MNTAHFVIAIGVGMLAGTYSWLFPAFAFEIGWLGGACFIYILCVRNENE